MNSSDSLEEKIKRAGTRAGRASEDALRAVRVRRHVLL